MVNLFSVLLSFSFDLLGFPLFPIFSLLLIGHLALFFLFTFLLSRFSVCFRQGLNMMACASLARYFSAFVIGFAFVLGLGKILAVIIVLNPRMGGFLMPCTICRQRVLCSARATSSVHVKFFGMSMSRSPICLDSNMCLTARCTIRSSPVSSLSLFKRRRWPSHCNRLAL